jgi:uncharacterized cupredoxin-like copper-binding protein
VKKLVLVPALVLAGVGLAQAATHAASVKATEVEFHIKLSAPSGKAGKITFTVKNAGHLAHEFLVLKSNLAAGKLPLTGTTVNVAKAGKLIGGITGAGLKAGASKTITLSLPAGRYVLFCNLPAHYKSGQYATFTVK